MNLTRIAVMLGACVLLLSACTGQKTEADTTAAPVGTPVPASQSENPAVTEVVWPREEYASLDEEGRAAYRQTVEQRQAELEQEGQKELVGLIEAELESYISDKAADMGLTLRVQVTVEPDGSGVPVPVSVELTGPRSETLSRWLETELGVPAERQVWNEN